MDSVKDKKGFTFNLAPSTMSNRSIKGKSSALSKQNKRASVFATHNNTRSNSIDSFKKSIQVLPKMGKQILSSTYRESSLFNPDGVNQEKEDSFLEELTFKNERGKKQTKRANLQIKASSRVKKDELTLPSSSSRFKLMRNVLDFKSSLQPSPKDQVRSLAGAPNVNSAIGQKNKFNRSGSIASQELEDMERDARQDPRREDKNLKPFTCVNNYLDMRDSFSNGFPNQKSVELLKKRLQHNQLEKSKYDNFFTNLRHLSIDKVIQDSVRWKQKVNAMPKLKVISKKQIDEEFTIQTEAVKPAVNIYANTAQLDSNHVVNKILDNVGAAVAGSKLTNRYVFDKIPVRWEYPKEINYAQGEFLETREGVKLTTVGDKIYVHGGHHAMPVHGLSCFDPKKDSIQEVQLKNDSAMNSRVGHTFATMQGKIVIFGGQEYMPGDGLHSFRLRNDMIIIEPDKVICTKYTFPDSKIPARAFHASCVFGSYLVVHGGVNIDEKILRDLRIFQFKSSSWVHIENEGSVIGKLSHHSCCSHFRNPGVHIRARDPFSLRDANYADVKSGALTPTDGIYFFGGKDPQGQESAKLFFLKVYQGPIEATELFPSGTAPKPRYGHCLHSIEGTPYLVLFGGKNDHFFKIFDTRSCFNFVNILNVETLTWYKAEIGSRKLEPRFNFGSTALGTKLIIFGGLGDNNYIPARMDKLELDYKKVQQIIKEEKLRASGLPYNNLYSRKSSQDELQAIVQTAIEKKKKLEEEELRAKEVKEVMDQKAGGNYESLLSQAYKPVIKESPIVKEKRLLLETQRGWTYQALPP